MNIDLIKPIDSNKVWDEKTNAVSQAEGALSSSTTQSTDTYIKTISQTQQAKESSNLSVEKDDEKKNDENKTQKEESTKHLDIDNTVLSFEKHEETGDIMVKIIDKVSGEVIREIPPEKILDSIAELWKCSGFKVDKKV